MTELETLHRRHVNKYNTDQLERGINTSDHQKANLQGEPPGLARRGSPLDIHGGVIIPQGVLRIDVSTSGHIFKHHRRQVPAHSSAAALLATGLECCRLLVSGEVTTISQCICFRSSYRSEFYFLPGIYTRGML
jgi:hypothetical protein